MLAEGLLNLSRFILIVIPSETKNENIAGRLPENSRN